MLNWLFTPQAAEAATEASGWGEKASTAGVVTLMGMVTIFVVLALLWAAVEIMHRIVGGKKEKKVKEQKAKAPASVASPAPQAPVAVQTDDGATVAAITAAISAYLAEEGYVGGFRVVSFKRAPSGQRKSRI